ncbi:uncharacterized protein LOC129143943 isoform X4 [Pan troglodytes]|uniref:uncharacterized protein LOC129143943 isoform X4 n=1 Tax=Pan troglodytes TaxID=9598 RepID=UPI003013A3FF
MLLFLCTYYQSGNVVTPVTPECFLMTAFLLAVSNSFTQQGTGQMACRYMLETGSHMRWQRGQDKNSAFGKRITHGLPPTGKKKTILSLILFKDPEKYVEFPGILKGKRASSFIKVSTSMDVFGPSDE